MADEAITQLAAYTTQHADDLVEIVDVHDTSMASTGTNKKMTMAQLSPTIQGNGVAATERIKINFAGSGMVVTDDATNTRTIITFVSQAEASYCGAP